MKFLKLHQAFSTNSEILINADDISTITAYGQQAWITMRSLTSRPGPDGRAYLEHMSFGVLETVADIEVMLGMRPAPSPSAFSLEEIEQAQDHINASGNH